VTAQPEPAPGEQTPEESEHTLLRQQVSQISQRVTVSGDLLLYLTGFQHFSEKRVRKLLGQAVDNSIVEILPPVVDRSVTIALITTRELVLKDFAYDGNAEKVLMAADSSVQSLAGSLALVTCREPLRMSLNTNLRKTFEQLFRVELAVDVVKSTREGGPFPVEDLGSEKRPSSPEPELPEGGFRVSVTEDKLNDLAVLASRENLELGCSLIKKKVIEKALRKVREDPQILQAVERRQRSAELGIRLFKDETIVGQFHDLPPQLQPDPAGLSPAQFTVYQDFAKLNGEAPFLEAEPGATSVPPSRRPQDLTSILKALEQEGLSEPSQQALLAKIREMNQSTPNAEDKEKLWAYVQGNFKEACKSFVQLGSTSTRARQVLEQTFRLLSLVVTNYTVDDFSVRLLKGFLQIGDVRIFNDLDLNITLMEKRIISLAEWDKQIANHFKAEGAALPQQELKFFASILETGIVGKKIFTKEQVPQLIAVIEGLTQDQNIGKQCQFILDSLNGAKQSEFNTVKLRDLYIKWVVISYLDGGGD
jgi:hypothetical protein